MRHFFYTAAIALVLALHLAWILFVIVGAFFSRGRPKLTIFHLAALLWGVVVEIGPWPCPLTLAENFLEIRAGIVPYSGSFLVHYLDRIVYPDLPVGIIVGCAVAVCGVNLAVYCYRAGRIFIRKRRAG